MIWNDSVTRGTLHCGVMCFLISAPVNSVFVRYGNNSERAGSDGGMVLSCAMVGVENGSYV